MSVVGSPILAPTHGVRKRCRHFISTELRISLFVFQKKKTEKPSGVCGAGFRVLRIIRSELRIDFIK